MVVKYKATNYKEWLFEHDIYHSKIELLLLNVNNTKYWRSLKVKNVLFTLTVIIIILFKQIYIFIRFSIQRKKIVSNL